MPELNTNPDPERGFTIYRAEDLSIMCVVWPEGGGAPVHNHNGWAMEGVISGLERNRNYARLDDGSAMGGASKKRAQHRQAGETTRPLPPNDITPWSPGGKTLAIHVYGNDPPSNGATSSISSRARSSRSARHALAVLGGPIAILTRGESQRV
jgi:predicted metal-dependent enzyme (double-stranded beta helix superfamily)